MLQPTNDPQVWKGEFPASAIAQGQLAVTAYDLAGNTSAHRVATFEPIIKNNTQDIGVQVLNKVYSPRDLDIFYALFVIVMLGLLGLSIGIKKHVQHIFMIAETATLIAVAAIIWVK